MLTEVSPDGARSPAATPKFAPAPAAWWARLLARLPLGVLYGVSGLLAWLAFHVFPYRERIVRDNLAKAFPDLDDPGIRSIIRRYYAGFAQMLMEIIKSVSMPAEELRRRVRIINLEQPRELLSQGQSVLLVAAHQCNWEWMLLALSLELGYPVDAAYKPLVNPWAEREMKLVRRRFGSRLVPAKDLLGDMIQRRTIVRAVAMVADQEPTTSEHKHWTRFLNRDTAFYMGPEEISRVTRLPVFFILMRRTARGFYEVEFEQLAAAGVRLKPGELTERYVRRVEQQIRAAPPDWPWSHKRWKLKRSVYNRKPARAPES